MRLYMNRLDVLFGAYLGCTQKPAKITGTGSFTVNFSLLVPLQWLSAAPLKLSSITQKVKLVEQL